MREQENREASPKKNICFIVNPFSGVGRNKDLENKLPRLLDHDQFDYSIMYTDYAGHATALAADAVQANYDIIVAVGGDGSVNEVAKSLIGTNKLLGILPAGSGNGFAMHLGLGRNIDRAITYLNEGASMTVDTCLVNDRHYVNLAGVGFDGLVAYQMKNSTFRGLWGYVWLAIRETWNFKFPKYKITMDGKVIERDCLVVEVANAPMFGYNFLIAPQAKLNDGVLDIVVLKKVPKWRYLLSAWRFFNGTFHQSSLTETFVAKEVSIEVKKEAYVHVDGEGFRSSDDLNFSINALSLQVITPKGSKKVS